ncbi:MarR family winged helix-turn-helix transcriptional regulator [Nonomuraea salmonea]|uniref:MarR family winged helix-turn-helix transcriptional regulator n=1 Tax=Nonomuraea salmonea TaxID=46181 RepID=UPI002FEA7D72
MPGQRSITEAEKLVEAKLGGTPIDRERMALVANIYRAAAAVRHHLENAVLRSGDLTWTAFVVLWVIWIWGEPESRHVARESGISKGTLTGVLHTLESRGLVERHRHASDGRLVLVRLTAAGEEFMRGVAARVQRRGVVHHLPPRPRRLPGADRRAAPGRPAGGGARRGAAAGAARRRQARAAPQRAPPPLMKVHSASPGGVYLGAFLVHRAAPSVGGVGFSPPMTWSR